MELDKIVRNIIRESLERQKMLFETESKDGSIVNLYQSTSEENLERLKKDPSFSAEYFGSRGGNMHTRAVYANLELSQALKQNYGDVVVKLNFYGGFKNVLCVNKYIAKKYFGGKNIIDQLKEYPDLYALLDNNIKTELYNAFKTGENESYAIADLCNFLGKIEMASRQQKGDNVTQIAHKSSGGAAIQDFSHAILRRFGIRGFIYYGKFDGMCVIPLNADEVIPSAYIINPKKDKTATWHSFNTKYDPSKINHIQAFMAKFGDKYEWDRNERSYLGTILVKDRTNNLFYFLDTTNGGSVMFDNTGFYNARQFDPNTRKAWVQLTPDDRGYFIDKSGVLYRTAKGRPFTELYYYLNSSSDENNNADVDFSGVDFSQFDLS